MSKPLEHVFNSPRFLSCLISHLFENRWFLIREASVGACPFDAVTAWLRRFVKHEELKRKAQVIYQANANIEVVFQSDEAVSFNSVAKAMAAVQSVGISKIGIVTTGYAD